MWNDGEEWCPTGIYRPQTEAEKTKFVDELKTLQVNT
jgi:hypothetical protein